MHFADAVSGRSGQGRTGVVMRPAIAETKKFRGPCTRTWGGCTEGTGARVPSTRRSYEAPSITKMPLAGEVAGANSGAAGKIGGVAGGVGGVGAAAGAAEPMFMTAAA